MKNSGGGSGRGTDHVFDFLRRDVEVGPLGRDFCSPCATGWSRSCARRGAGAMKGQSVRRDLGRGGTPASPARAGVGRASSGRAAGELAAGASG